LEFFDPRVAAEYWAMPKRLYNVEQQQLQNIQQLKQQLQNIQQLNQEMLKMMKQKQASSDDYNDKSEKGVESK
jgi:response regulator of citrate/malate metabolism